MRALQADNCRLTGLCSDLSKEALLLVEQVQKSLDSPTGVWPQHASVPPAHAHITPPPSDSQPDAPKASLRAHSSHTDPSNVPTTTSAAAAAAGEEAAAAADYTIPAVRVRQPPRQYRSLPSLLAHQPCFSMGVDWSAIDLLHPAAERQRGAKFMPGTSIQDFECHQVCEGGGSYNPGTRNNPLIRKPSRNGSAALPGCASAPR